MADLRIATRGSQLAMTQTRWVADRIISVHPDVEIEIVTISTTGDIDRVSPVASLTEMGAFVRAVQYAVLDGRADLAVHSCKDLPVEGPADLTAWYPEREAPWDVLCGSALADLPIGARVGSGSPRRKSQLEWLRPDVEVVEIRGNVGTRLGKVGDEVDAVILAEAGLNRLDLADRIDHRFTLDEMVPAPAQAVLCIEAVAGTAPVAVLEQLDDPVTRAAVEIERLLLAETGAGCRSALGALATATESGFRVSGFVGDENGPRRGSVAGSDPETIVSALRSDLGI